MRKIHLFLILFASITLVIFKYEWRNNIQHHSATTKKLHTVFPTDTAIGGTQIWKQQTQLLQRQTDSLLQQLSRIQLQWQQERLQVLQWKKIVQHFLKKDTSKNIQARLMNCDSMKIQIGILNFHGKQTDSLCEQAQENYAEILQKKEVEIAIQQQNEQQLKKKIIEVQQEQSIAYQTLQKVQHQNHRQRIATRIWRTSALMAGSILIYPFIISQLKI